MQGQRVQVEVLGKQTLFCDQRGTSGPYKALGEPRVPNLSTRLMCPHFLSLCPAVLPATEARVSVPASVEQGSS